MSACRDAPDGDAVPSAYDVGVHRSGRPDAVVRSPLEADAHAWARFLAVEQARTYAGLMPSWFGESQLARVPEAALALARRIAAPEGWRGVLAERDGEIVGVAAAGPAPAAWEVELGLVPPPAEVQLDKIYVSPTEHGTGLADRLMAAVLDPGPAYLWLIDGNDRAHAFYARRGFTSLDEHVLAGESWGHVPMHRMLRT